MKYKKFSTDLKCRKILYQMHPEAFICGSCGGSTFYKSKNLDKVCITCKKRKSPSKDTIFENVRFGLVKAFSIMAFCYDEGFKTSSTELAVKFKITQKTAWHFKNKLVNNKDEVQRLMNEDVIQENKTISKLEDFFKKSNALTERLKNNN